MGIKKYNSIYEKAMSLSDAKNLALVNWKDGSDIYILIYDPSVILSSSEAHIISNYRNWFDAIYATASFGPDNDVPKSAWVIQRTASKPGTKIGPLMYDIILSIAALKNKGIVPDRYSVSNLAQKVWEYYFTSRSDVKKIKIDDESDPVTDPVSDDGKIYNPKKIPDDYENRSFINHVYKITSPKNFSTLMQNHMDVVSSVKKYGISNKQLIKILDDAAHQFFVHWYSNKDKR